jgi:integral membrane sensor domain MASE1
MQFEDLVWLAEEPAVERPVAHRSKVKLGDVLALAAAAITIGAIVGASIGAVLVVLVG